MFAVLQSRDVDLTEKVCDMTGMDMVRFSNSGSETTQAAIRLVRDYIGKDKIIKLEGAYHDGHDYVLVGTGDAPSDRLPTALNRIPRVLGHPWRFAEEHDSRET